MDGVGVQAHLDLGKGPLKRELLAPFFSRIADLGLGIAITELDVKEHDLRGDVAGLGSAVPQGGLAIIDGAYFGDLFPGVPP